MVKTATKALPDPRHVLTTAVVRAAGLLQVKQALLADILGLSPATISRMSNGTYALDTRKKEWELAALFVRLFRSLDALIGSNDRAAQAWLSGENLALGARPIELIRTTEGLVRAVQYLDSTRGRI